MLKKVTTERAPVAGQANARGQGRGAGGGRSLLGGLEGLGDPSQAAAVRGGCVREREMLRIRRASVRDQLLQDALSTRIRSFNGIQSQVFWSMAYPVTPSRTLQN